MSQDLNQIARTYASSNNQTVRELLGVGIHGLVFLIQGNTTLGGTALKVFHTLDCFQRELLVYERLRAYGVRQVLGFHVPQFIRANSELSALEMTVVERPFIFDRMDWGSSGLHSDARLGLDPVGWATI